MASFSSVTDFKPFKTMWKINVGIIQLWKQYSAARGLTIEMVVVDSNVRFIVFFCCLKSYLYRRYVLMIFFFGNVHCREWKFMRPWRRIWWIDLIQFCPRVIQRYSSTSQLVTHVVRTELLTIYTRFLFLKPHVWKIASCPLRFLGLSLLTIVIFLMGRSIRTTWLVSSF